MMASRHTIITLVMRSTPFCRPSEHTPMAMATATTIQVTSSAGLASMLSKAAAVWAVLASEKVPEAILGT